MTSMKTSRLFRYKTIFTLLAILVFIIPVKAQNFREKGHLPLFLNECSGISKIGIDSFLVHNDSGNSSEIYLIDSNAVFIKKYFINASNIDWESITTDNQKNIYIGDFGNNANDRNDLRILKLSYAALNNDSITPEIIQFNYENQTSFPPSAIGLNFDAEAFIHYQNNLYIFSKNRTNPFTGVTYCHKISDIPGSHTTILIDSFDTQETTIFKGWVTDASIYQNKLALLTSDKFWIFDISNEHFFQNTPIVYQLYNNTQKEGICFYDINNIYITDEVNSVLGGGKLYQYKFSNSTTFLEEENTAFDIKLTNNKIEILKLSNETSCSIFIETLDGKVVYSGTFLNNSFELDMQPNQTYIVNIISKDKSIYKKIVAFY